MNSRIECLRCRTVMEPGFILDRGHGNAAANVTTWFSGLPDRNWWGGIRTKGLEKVPLARHLCKKCGYVEFRATEKRDK